MSSARSFRFTRRSDWQSWRRPSRSHRSRSRPSLRRSSPSASRPWPSATPSRRVSFKNLNPAADVSLVDLSKHRGKQTVVLAYMIAGNVRSEQLLKDVEDYVAGLKGDSIALYGIVYLQPDRGEDLVRRRLAENGITSPVLEDEGFRLGQQLSVRSVPSVAVIDRDGNFKFTNGGSLRHQMERDLDLAGVLTRAADGKSIGTYGMLDLYHPVQELVGERCPDYSAKLVGQAEGERQLRSLLDPKKVNVWIYWSVECGHCRAYLPKFNEWMKANAETVNVITTAAVPNETVRIKTEEFCDLKGIGIPTMLDYENKVGDLYQITTTPTVLLMGPDGTVKRVLGSAEDFAAEIDEVRSELSLDG